MGTTQKQLKHLKKEDVQRAEILGKGASGYVYRALHSESGKELALKSINFLDQGKRNQLVNDLAALANHECPFIVEYVGIIYIKGQKSVEVALELMDLGTLNSIVETAFEQKIQKEGGLQKITLPLISEAIVAKIAQQVLQGLAYLSVLSK